MLFFNQNLFLTPKLLTSTKVSKLCCAECATLINQSAEAVQMFLNAEYFWTSYLDSTESTLQPYEDQVKSKELLSNDGSIEILDSSIKEEFEDLPYEKKNDVHFETTVALSITPAGHTLFEGEDEEDQKSNISFVHYTGPSDYSVEEYTIS